LSPHLEGSSPVGANIETGEERIMPDSIILLGPWQAGKSTVGRLLAERLQMPFCDLPSKAGEYWAAAGFDRDTFRRLHQQEGVEAVSRYVLPFEVATLERGLQDHPHSVVEAGPLQTVQHQPELLTRVRAALAPFANVFLLLPTPDVDESERILYERGAKERINGMEFDECEYFIRHHSNFDLAKQIVYTKGKAPQQSCEEILTRMTPGSDVILIGPPYAGKSTLGHLLAQRLGLPNVSMDRRRWDYYREIGWDGDEEARIGAAEGYAGIYRYSKKFELHAVGRLLEEHDNCVFDFGAGHSVYEDEAQFSRVQELLAPYPNVFLLLPSPDLDESVAIVRHRGGFIRNGMPANRFFLMHLANAGLAKHVVYTAERTPEQTCDEILGSRRPSVGCSVTDEQNLALKSELRQRRDSSHTPS
jgi:shikimate kinase